MRLTSEQRGAHKSPCQNEKDTAASDGVDVDSSAATAANQ